MKPTPKREQAFDLSRYEERRVSVKFFGGIEVEGVLEGYDAIVNLVLRNARVVSTPTNGEEAGKCAGVLLCRGNSIVSVELLE
jgi:U6 snRNA-associated Sm-like protein LSm7